jgi:hypothetical protein
MLSADQSSIYHGLYFDNSVADLTFFFYYTGAVWEGQLSTTGLFRDPSAWYHVVIVADTTNATSGDRLRMYVNGS